MKYLFLGIVLDRVIFSLGMYISLKELYNGNEGSFLEVLGTYLTWYLGLN